MENNSVTSSDTKEFETLLAESMDNSKLKEGSIIKGIISEIEDEAVIVDIGAKVEGRIPKRELAFQNCKALGNRFYII